MKKIRNSVAGGFAWLIITFSAAAFGSSFQPGEWYSQLNKPEWNPPDYIFAPVWTVLYFLMAFSAWNLWRKHGLRNAVIPLGLFLFQLVLNAAWSWLFFGLNTISGALAELTLLWFAVVATTLSFWNKEPLSGVFLLPYLGWVSFALYLNWTLLRLNS